MISDQSKLWLLAALWCACCATFFTSSSRFMGPRDLGTIPPQVHIYCKEPRDLAVKCLDKKAGQDSSCSSLLKQATKCEDALQNAFRHVNMGGCPHEIQAVTICEVEWCQDVHDSKTQEACQKECLAVRKSLDSCAKRHVASFFRKYGLEDNGTIKLQ